MSRIEPVEISVETEHILAEIKTLSDQQNTTIQNAAFIGITDSEEAEYRKRAEKLARLLKQLALLHAPSFLSRLKPVHWR